MESLFKEEDIPKRKETTNTCRHCYYRQRWECDSKVISYCGAIKSNRTFNGLKKIKCTNKACELYKEK